MPTLLLIDDEPVIQHAFRKAFHPPGYETLTARTAAEGVALLAARRPDVVVLDVHLPDATGLQAFDRIKQVDARTPVILVTGHGTTDLAIEAMKRGAFDYLLKPLAYDQLRELVDRACVSSRLMHVPAVVGEGAPAESDALVGRCPAIQEVFKAIGRVAGTNATVLILGESGTGKELVARAIYQHSKRADKPFLAVNCGAIPESLLESELFGHEKGAFTGADRKRIGKFEQCQGGTLLLDEVGELSILAQVKLLRALQEQRFERVGGTETVQTDVRVIAATNAELETLSAAGRFRSDLYFRLNVFTIRLPPLRERGDDIDLLTDYYLVRFGREFDRPVPVVPQETRLLIRGYRWPGNVRELQSALKQGLLQMSGSVLLPEFLTAVRRSAATVASPSDAPGEDQSGPPAPRPALDWNQFMTERLAAGSHELYAECLSLMERQLLSRVLERTAGNQLRAAELLGITRGSLRHKLRALGITIERGVSTDDDQGD
ncbi:MAG: response regulator with CheY-like receiver, AAA-type ATPase, and DNA-binding domain [Gemmataceae bacterium]|nr:response regulator with CheY-like receiver, AAA-type ATPase, and DNA-binding domain [Gemmataceae bacterium]